MKRILFLIPFALFTWSCNNTSKSEKTASANTKTSESAPKFQFDQTSYDFGLIDAGDTVVHNYAFVNVGKTPMIITDAQATCGCTIPEYPHEPIAPGKDGNIKVIFNSANKFGKQTKAITLTANTVPVTTQLYLTGEIRDNKNK